MRTKTTTHAKNSHGNADSYARWLGALSLVLSLLGFVWAIWTWHRLDAIYRAEKRTALVTTLQRVHQAAAQAQHQLDRVVDQVVPAFDQVQCSDRRAAGELISSAMADSKKLWKQEVQVDHMVAQLVAEPPPPESAEDLEAARSRELQLETNGADYISELNIDSREEQARKLLSNLSATRVDCPEKQK